MGENKLLKIFRKIAYNKIAINSFLAIIFPLLFYIAHYYCHFLIWVAFAPVILLMLRNKLLTLFFYLLPAVFIATGLQVYFIKDFDFRYLILSFVFVSVVYFLSFFIFSILFKKIKYPLAVFIPSIIWLIVINLCSLIEGGNLWFDYGYLQPMLFPLTWIIGRQGITFLILLVNSLVAFYFFSGNKKNIKYVVAIFVVLASCFIYSYLAIPAGQKVRVALIQGNINKDWQWRIANGSSEIFDIYKRLSLEASKSQPDLIIWPEFAIPEDIKNNQDLFGAISELARKTNANLVIGSVGRTERTDPEFNYIKDVAYVFSRNGDYLGEYVAVLPFPFNGFIIPGNELPVFTADIGKFGITSCVEESYNFFNKNYVKSGAELLINISNDEPIKNLKMRWLKSMLSRFSASENHKYLVRVANTGYTEVINPYGKTEAKMEPNKEGFLIADIYIK